MYPTEEVLQSEDWPGLIDTHCHLDLEPLYARLGDELTEARRAGVRKFVIPGVHPEGWERMKTAGHDHAGVYPAFGIHPMHAGLADDACLARLESFAQGAVALGEIGLDPAYQIGMEQQEQAFREQLRLALRLGLPVLIHCRQVFQRTLQILREERIGQVGGIMHAYSGSPEMAREFIRLGLAIALSGIITRESARRSLRVVREVPLENLVLETDAPDLTPRRYFGLPNRPAYLPEILVTVAQLKNISAYEAARACRRTTFNILPAVDQS